jgi:hypothetical protein
MVEAINKPYKDEELSHTSLSKMSANVDAYK